MRNRRLLRLFLHGLLDHELVSPHADRREVLSLTIGALVAVGLFLAVVLAVKYQFNQFMPPGLTTVFSLNDRALFVSLSMIVLALVAVAEWDALALDPRDTSVLGVLPIPHGAIVRAKFVAALIFGSVFAAALNVAPTVLRAAALPERLPITATGVLRLTLAHGMVTFAAGVFGFLAVLALREVLHAALGSRRFARVSSWVQAALIVFLVTTLFLLPTSYGGASRWLADGRLSAGANPVAWFVGLHEAAAGVVIDGLPRGAPPRFQATAEGVAAGEYQRLRPRFRALARLAVGAVIAVALLAIAGCAWNGRRWPLPTSARSRRRGATGRAGRWMVVHVIVPRPAMQAGFLFTIHTLFRQASHRTTLAAAAAFGLAFAILMASAGQSEPVHSWAATPVLLLAAQTGWLAALLSGFRHAVRLPAHLSATTTFALAWGGDAGTYVAGVKRAGWIALALPALVGVAVWHTVVLGAAAAFWHGLVGVAVAALLMESLFFSYRGLPFASAYEPSDAIKAGGLLLVTAVIGFALGLAWLERTALATPAGTVVFVGCLVAASVAINAVKVRRERNQDPPDLDGSTDSVTQRLDLSD